MSAKISSLLKITKYFLLSNLRSSEALFFGFAFPLIFTAIFSMIGQAPPSYQVGLTTDSITEGFLYEIIDENEIIELTQDKDQQEMEEGLKKGQIPAIIRIRENQNQSEENFGESVYILDLQLSNASPQGGSIVKSVLSQIVSQVNQEANPEAISLVEIETSNIDGRAYSQVDFILPGQLSFALLSTAIFGIAFSFITQRKTLVLKRMAATSSPRWLILTAKVLANVIIATMQAAVVIGAGYLFFNFTLINGWQTFFEMIILSVFGLLVFLSFGLLVASISKDEEAASPIANLITLPQFILSGAFFPIEVLPDWLQSIARYLPMTFLNDALRRISFEGGSFRAVLPEILGLTIWAIIIYIPVTKLFRWE